MREANGTRNVGVPLVREDFGTLVFAQSVMVGDGSYLPRLAGIWVLYYPVLLTDLYGKVSAAAQADGQAICEG